MKSTRSLVGMPVICSGRKAGRVVQARLSDDLTRLEGVWVDSGLLGTRFIPAEHICRLGEVAVLADSRGRRRRCDQPPLLRRALTTDGVRVGAISGAEVNETTFRVEALELTKGCLDDLLRGRTRVWSFTAGADGAVIISAADAQGADTFVLLGKEGDSDEGTHSQGTDDRYAHRRFGGYALWRHELADGAQVERAGQKNRPLDGR